MNQNPTISTIFLQAVQAMVATLQAAPAVAPKVYRTRLRPLTQQDSTAVVVRLAGSDPDTSVGQGAVMVWGTAVSVECYARGNTLAPADEAVDDLLARVYTRLQQDPSLGGVAGGVTPHSLSVDYDADGDQTACATVTLLVRHASAPASVQPF